MVKIGAELPKL